jgi:indole-3-acetate monooxygenase
VLRALHDASLFRLLLPAFLDGGEIDPVTWCLCQAAGCSMTAAYLRPEVGREIFGDRRGGAGLGAEQRCPRDGGHGGYRIDGTWSFGSGCRHAT